MANERQAQIDLKASVAANFPAERRIEGLIDREPNPGVRRLWEHFSAISEIPRLSGQEEGVREYLRGFVTERAERGVKYHQDEAGNVAILVPATEGHEEDSGVMLQGHMDMVCLPAGEKGPVVAGVQQVVDESGELLQSATGSTSGADNGIGIAAALALADSEAHGPLMIVATVDEEIGLEGAMNIEFPDVDTSSYKYMVNLDSEVEGEITIGCCGGAGTDIVLPLQREPIADGALLVEISIGGLFGGHSGLKIGENRLNALKLIKTALTQVTKEIKGSQIVNLHGGNAENAIPKDATAYVAIQPDQRQVLQDVMYDVFLGAQVVAAAIGSDEEISVLLDLADIEDASMGALTSESATVALNLIDALPHGVEKWTEYKEGLPETSTNLGLAETTSDELRIRMLSRSFVDADRHVLEEKIAETAIALGAEVHQEPGYDAWQPDPNNELVAMVEEAYREMTGVDAELVAEHFGVECGVILARPQFQHLNAVSIGPKINGAHETGESVEIKSVRRFYQFLEATVLRIAA